MLSHPSAKGAEGWGTDRLCPGRRGSLPEKPAKSTKMKKSKDIRSEIG
jgi:hypothetical protein